ncbi:MAG: helix-turn-helix transcriptional regulator [Gemmatimonadetes bacterium]|nr:helix-turn-helix transcriptional regulator [Gemmatimonadota bacterium]
MRSHRTRHKPSQATLATLADVRMGTISEIEIGKSNPRVSTVESIALALRLDPTFLVHRPVKDEVAS